MYRIYGSILCLISCQLFENSHFFISFNILAVSRFKPMSSFFIKQPIPESYRQFFFWKLKPIHNISLFLTSLFMTFHPQFLRLQFALHKQFTVLSMAPVLWCLLQGRSWHVVFCKSSNSLFGLECLVLKPIFNRIFNVRSFNQHSLRQIRKKTCHEVWAVYYKRMIETSIGRYLLVIFRKRKVICCYHFSRVI